jgi:hypothetical protein
MILKSRDATNVQALKNKKCPGWGHFFISLQFDFLPVIQLSVFYTLRCGSFKDLSWIFVMTELAFHRQLHLVFSQ